MDYKIFNYLNLDDLHELRETIANDEMRKYLIEYIDVVINSRRQKNGRNEVYSNDFIPYYNDLYEEKCLNLLSKINLKQVSFLIRSFREKGNNGVSLYKDDIVLHFLGECLNIKEYDVDWILFYPSIYGSDYSIVGLEKFFKSKDFKLKYNMTYNLYNYVKSYIYQCLMINKDCDVSFIFKDFRQKLMIARDDIGKIAAYLYELRESGDNLKCSVSNAGLKRTAQRKSRGSLTDSQSRLAEAVAFGTTLEKIKKENYEDSKKLIYC